MIISMTSFFTPVITHEQVNLTQIAVDENTLQTVYEYNTLNYSNDTGLVLIGWSSLGIFFLLIVSVFYLKRDDY